MNIYEKTQQVKKDLITLNLKKTGCNKFAGYTYYELADFIPAIVDLCVKHKLFTQVTFDENLAYLNIFNSEKPDEALTYTSPMRALELKGCNAVQALGGVETYQRRYLYMAAFDIVEADMFDGAPQEPPKPQPQPQPTAKPKPQTCSKCDSLIEPYIGTDGKTVSIEKHCAGSNAKFGKVLCIDCIKEGK